MDKVMVILFIYFVGYLGMYEEWCKIFDFE